MFLKGAIWLYTGVRKRNGYQAQRFSHHGHQLGLELPVQPCWVPRPPEGVSLHLPIPRGFCVVLGI